MIWNWKTLSSNWASIGIYWLNEWTRMKKDKFNFKNSDSKRIKNPTRLYFLNPFLMSQKMVYYWNDFLYRRRLRKCGYKDIGSMSFIKAIFPKNETRFEIFKRTIASNWRDFSHRFSGNFVFISLSYHKKEEFWFIFVAAHHPATIIMSVLKYIYIL